jgi:hypothetical protein
MAKKMSRRKRRRILRANPREKNHLPRVEKNPKVLTLTMLKMSRRKRRRILRANPREKNLLPRVVKNPKVLTLTMLKRSKRKRRRILRANHHQLKTRKIQISRKLSRILLAKLLKRKPKKLNLILLKLKEFRE